jgi:hypothetical protein
MIKEIKFGNLKLLCNQNRNENNHLVKFIYDLFIKGLSYQNNLFTNINELPL